MARPVLNTDHLRSFSLGNAELEREVMGLFLADLPLTVAAARGAADEKNWRAWLHRLRGSAMGVGAERLTDATRQAEALAFSEGASRAVALDRVEAEIEAVVAEAVSLGLALPRPPLD